MPKSAVERHRESSGVGTEHVRFGRRTVVLPVGSVLEEGRPTVHLTEMETALLQYLVDRPDQTVSREELHREVWGYADAVRTRAVDFTMSRLRRKVECDGSRILLTIRGEGYRFQPEVAPIPLRTAAPDSSRLFGRKEELDQIQAQFQGGVQCVTLLGIGGLGKTRMAVEFLERWPGRGVFVDLSDAHSLAHATERAARALNLPLQPRMALAPRVASVLPTHSTLVVFDAVEKLHGVIEPLVAGCLAEENVRVLLTSRRRVRVSGGYEIAVGPLDGPAATAMLRDRIHGMGNRHHPLEDDDLDQLARALGAWPLAIELAAARVRALPPLVFLERLNLLGLESRGAQAPDRLRSVRVVLEDTWTLLSERQRRTLAAMALMPHGCSLSALEFLLSEPDILSVVESLSDHALVRFDEHQRLRLDMVLVEWLRAQEVVPGLHRRRVSWACVVAESAAHDLRQGLPWTPSDDVELPNVLATCQEHAPIDEEFVRVAIALCWWRAERASLEGLDAFATRTCRFAESLGDVSLLRSAQLARAKVLRQTHDFEGVVELTHPLVGAMTGWEQDEARLMLALGLRRTRRREQAEEILMPLAEQRSLTGARAVSDLSLIRMAQGRVDEAIQCARRAEALVRRYDAPALETQAALRLSFLLRSADRLAAAREVVQRAVSASAISGRLMLRRLTWHERCAIAVHEGELDEAASHAEQELELCRQHGDVPGAAWAMCNRAMILAELGQLVEARSLLERAEAEHALAGTPVGRAVTTGNMGILYLLANEPDHAATRLTEAIAAAEPLGLARYVPTYRAFLDIARGRAPEEPAWASPQDLRLIRRAAARLG